MFSVTLIRIITRISGAAFALSLTVSLAAAEPVEIESSQITAFPGASFMDSSIQFAGGLLLNSSSANFGGFSGLRFLNNGQRLIAISDVANWLTAVVDRDDNKKPIGLKNAELFCLCQRNGEPYASKRWSDAEALEIDGNTAFVAFERLHRINRYRLNDDFSPGPPTQATVSLQPLGLNYNKGLEGLAVIPSGQYAGNFIALSEDTRTGEGYHRGFIISEREIHEFSVVEEDGYATTDAAFSPSGDLLLLERYYSLLGGIGMRIRSTPLEAIHPGAILAPKPLLVSRAFTVIDNMEALAVWQDSDGQTRISVLSDDNFSDRQKTLLFEFTLLDERQAPASER
jgi:hypothetical protein